MTTTIRFPPPPRFQPAGEVLWAELAHSPPFVSERIARQRNAGARGAGNRYEQKAQEYLASTLGSAYVASPWFVYRSRGRQGAFFAQADGLYIDLERGVITCFEIKIKHTDRAWWQTRQLYVPILKHIFGTAQWSYAVVEVCCWFDPHVSFPERLVEILDLAPDRFAPGPFNVHVWNPARHYGNTSFR